MFGLTFRVATISAIAIGLLMQLDRVQLSDAEMSKIFGGVGDCEYASPTGAEACSFCQNGFKCTSSRAHDVCKTFQWDPYNPSCVACYANEPGTCSGDKRYYPSSPDDCEGASQHVGFCGRPYTSYSTGQCSDPQKICG